MRFSVGSLLQPKTALFLPWATLFPGGQHAETEVREVVLDLGALTATSEVDPTPHVTCQAEGVLHVKFQAGGTDGCGTHR